MSAAELDRRGFAAAVLAVGAAAAVPAKAEIVSVTPGASRLRAPIVEDYVPPRDLKTISDIYKRMTAPVRVNGAGPFPFVVDTGANQSVIAEDLAAQLGLTVGEDQPLNGVAGIQITHTARARLQVGERTINEAVLSLLPAAAIGGMGMVGLDQLDGGRLTLDFRRQTMTVATGRAAPLGADEVSLRARRRSGQLTLVDADLAGIHVTAFLDSGAQDSIGNMALHELAVARYPTIPWVKTPILSVTGQTINAQLADLPSLRIGGLRLPNWPMAFADLHTFQMWDLTDRPAILIGVDILSRFETVCLDFAHDEVRLRLPQRG
ncbi:MAG: aspartyl protease family protein [Caulobacterales bacterium]